MSDPSCLECGVTSGRALARGIPTLRLGPFVVHPKLEAPRVPGWMILAPVRHVEQWDELDSRERALIGPLVARLAAALRAETPTAKVYVSVFAELVPHLHLHVVARPPELPPPERGAAVFLAPPPPEGATGEADLVHRIYTRLLRGSSSPWPAVLLSGLLWPGAGQLKNGEWGKGIALALGAAVIFARFVGRVAEEALSAILVAPAPLDPLQALQLALQIRNRHAAELGGLTFLLVVLWMVSVLDAWRGARLSS